MVQECCGRTVLLIPWELWEQMLVEEYSLSWVPIQSQQRGGKVGFSTELQAQPLTFRQLAILIRKCPGIRDLGFGELEGGCGLALCMSSSLSLKCQ